MTARDAAAGTAPAPAATEIRALRRDVASAEDSQVLKVLRLVEGLAERGEADALLAPVRRRLGMLRPARKLWFARLLFVPLDPVIVNPADWRPGTALVPRTALVAIATLLRARLPDVAGDIDVLVRAGYSTDTGLTRRCGALIWPRAAEVLEMAEMPPGWEAQSLPASEFPPLAQAIAFNLATELRLAALERPAVPRGEVENVLGELLAAAEQRGVQCWGMLLTRVLQRFPGAEAPLRAALVRNDGPRGRAGQAALDRAMASVAASVELRGAADLHLAARDLRRQAALLDRLASDPARRERAMALRAALHASNVQRFEAALRDRIASRLAPLPATGATAMLEAMERDARDLRQLEGELRHLGGDGHEAQLRALAQTILAQPGWEMFDRIRLVEILAGPQAALRALASAKG